MIAAPTAAAGLIRSTAATLDTSLPTGFTEAIERAEALVAAADAIGDGGPRQLHQAVIAALEAGRQPATDKATLSALTAMQLMNSGVSGAVKIHRDTSIEEAIREHSSAILASWASKLQPHLDALAEATVALGAVDDPTTMAATAVHPGHTSSWQAATEALRLTAAASSGANTIAATSHVTTTKEQSVLLWSRPNTDAYDRVRRTGVHPTPWLMSQQGATLVLIGSVGELRDRISGLAQQRQAAIDAVQESQRHPRKAALT